VLPYLFSLLFFAAAAGVIYPYYVKWNRKHFALATLGTFVGLVLTVPNPTPQELAAREAAEKKEEQEEVAAKASEEHQEVLKKASAAVEVPANYTRAEYGKTFARVGAATFAKLNELEPGAAYAAAESKSCNRANLAMVSDMSKPGAAVWFVDCENENRFMITQKEAEEALARFKAGKLALRTRERSCTLTSIADCKATPAQKASRNKEIEYVTACDMILESVVISPSSLDKHRWVFGFGQGDTVVIQRPFDSQNGFGAMLRSRYRCEIDASTNNLKGFVVEGALGRQKVI